MFRRRVRAYSDPADLPRPRPRRWRAAAFAVPLVAVGWTYLALTNQLSVQGGDTATATVRTIVVIAVLAGLGLASLYAIWRYRLELLARIPGPIVVVPIVDHTGDVKDSPRARRLTGEFQRRLADTRLYKSTAIPSSGTSSEFLDVVERAGESFAGFWTPIMRLLRLLRPVSAYQVRCELLGDRRGRKVVHVELLRLPASAIAPALIEEESWERAIEHAAHRVAAAILPRTRQCRTPPWTMWQDLRMPRPLFDLVQRFHTERVERRYDEALATLREAIRLDPSNLALRLELGKLQEKMDMHLDALLTYDDIVSRASRTNRDLSRWWNRSSSRDAPWDDDGPTPILSASHPVVHVARYRHALLLALGDKLAAQWWDRPLGCPLGIHRGAREQRRDYLRRILSERFTARYATIVAQLQEDGLTTMPASGYLSRREPRESDEERRAAALDARIFFTTVAVSELERLVAERQPGLRRRLPPEGQRSVLPRRSMELALFSAGLRRGMAFAYAGRVDRAGNAAVRRMLRSVNHPDQWLTVLGEWRAMTWPPSVEAVQGVVETILRSRRRTLHSWLEHYNAACVFALLLLPTADPFTASVQLDPRPDRVRRRIARLAVDELAKAVECSDSGYLASQRDWLLVEDPDLDQLRSFRAFRDFEAQTYGSVGRAYQRGPRMGIWQQTAHVADIISSSGAEMAGLWARRLAAVQQQTPSRAVLRRWVEEDREGWRLAELLAEDHRDWATRHRICRQISAWAQTAGIDLSRRPHPHYSEAKLARQLASMDGSDVVQPIDADAPPASTIATSLIKAMKAGDRRLADMAGALRVESFIGPLCCDRQRPLALAEEWADLLARFADETSPLDPELLAAWCDRSGRRRHALSLWFDDSTLALGNLQERQKRFKDTMSPLPSEA